MTAAPRKRGRRGRRKEGSRERNREDRRENPFSPSLVDKGRALPRRKRLSFGRLYFDRKTTKGLFFARLCFRGNPFSPSIVEKGRAVPRRKRLSFARLYFEQERIVLFETVLSFRGTPSVLHLPEKPTCQVHTQSRLGNARGNAGPFSTSCGRLLPAVCRGGIGPGLVPGAEPPLGPAGFAAVFGGGSGGGSWMVPRVVPAAGTTPRNHPKPPPIS